MAEHAGIGRTDKDQPVWVSFTPSGIRRAGVIVLLLVVALFIGMWAFSALNTFLFILLLAWLVSIAMEPVVLFLTDRGMKRGLATGVTMLVGFVIFAGLAEVFGAVFYAQVSQLGQSLPSTVSTALGWVNRTFRVNIDVGSIQNALQLTPDKIGQLLSTYGGGLLGIFGSITVFIFDGLTQGRVAGGSFTLRLPQIPA